jgi:hypothetical protein
MMMRKRIFGLALCFDAGLVVRVQEAPSGAAEVKQTAEIPKGYEVGEKSVSPNGRFAILYPIRSDDDADLPPNLLCVSSRTQS